MLSETAIMLDDIVSLLSSDAFWIAVGSFGAIVTLALTYRQIKRSEIIASADFLLKLEDRFCSGDMLKKRRRIMKILKHDPNDFKKMDECREVFEFFENLGILLRKKVISKELIWSDYCYWIQHYWAAFQGYVVWVRKNDSDPTLYCEFEYLFRQIHRYDERRRKETVAITPKQVEEFVAEEIKLDKSQAGENR